MKKYLLSSIIAVTLATGGAVAQTATTDPGVVINGVTWATRNVDAVGTFADNPESTGKFYQWNRKVAWAAEGEVTGWDTSIPTGTEWESANDPSPAGWRVPTLEEQQSLFDTEKVTNEWTTINGINGRLFTDIASGNTLFLPAAGHREYSDGTHIHFDMFGVYWTCTQTYENYAYYLYFSSGDVNWDNYQRTYGFCVRSVRLSEITGFVSIASIDGGTTSNPTYTDATAVITALPASVIANYSGGSILWSVSTWTDTDNYNPAAAGTYAFTAVLGTAPVGYANSGNYTATVNVVVNQPSGINSITNEELRITISDNGQLIIENYDDSDVHIFDTMGRTVGARLIAPLHATPATDGAQTINISHLPAGVYLVKAGNKTGKFAKK